MIIRQFRHLSARNFTHPTEKQDLTFVRICYAKSIEGTMPTAQQTNELQEPTAQQTNELQEILILDPDTFCRQTCEMDVQNTRDIKGDIVQHLDFAQVEVVSPDIIDNTLRVNLVFTVPYRAHKGDELTIYILLEHQSTVKRSDDKYAYRE